jgi:hypothetical protein
MQNYITPEKALQHEFGTQYLADELNADWGRAIPELAIGSARRLKSHIGEHQLNETIEILKAMHDDIGHPLNREVENNLFTDFAEETEEWEIFQKLLTAIIENLTS